MISIRESFGAKLLSALMGTVGLLLIVTLLVVRTVTAREVRAVTERTTQNAGLLFEERASFQNQVVATVTRPFTEGRRALLALRAAIQAGDFDELEARVDYEVDLLDLTEALLVFTDGEGTPVLSIVGGQRSTSADPAAVRPLAEQLLFGDSIEARAYRVIDGTMYSVRARYLELGARPIGTVTFGLPVLDADVRAIGRVGGFEACLFAAGSCVVQTAVVQENESLRTAMLASVGREESTRVESGGTRWSIQAQPLIPEHPEQGLRIIAVPLDGVIAPFESIQRALLFGGLGALLLSALLGAVLSRSLTRPVKALVAATGRVADGDYETVVHIDSTDELGTLATAFNDMTRGLLTRERYRSVLNKVVSEDIAEELMRGDVELGGENRQITVLFADIRGFTPLTEGMEPQQVIGLLNECMQRLASAVDAEGGVVDKFIGDEVMAVFGAPVSQANHAARAVRAAIRMRQGIRTMNEERLERGEKEIGVGIGIASGEAVAGNMGSRDRMNYTVLGTTVNLAARLTGAASADEILMSRPTHDAVADECVGAELGGRTLKGFSEAVDVFTVERMKTPAPAGPAADPSAGEATSTSAKARPASTSAIVLLAALTLGQLPTPTSVAAQWPTLADAGIGYLSGGGLFQVDLSGQMDLESFHFSNSEPGLSGLASGSDFLFAPRVRLFLDTFLGDHLYGLVEWRGDRGEAPTADFWEARLEQAYVRLSNTNGTVSLQGGIFASPFGSYASRHLSVVDPFIRPPLIYDHRTVISRRWAPASIDWFTDWKNSPDTWRPTGAPPVWGVPYQWGGMATVGNGFVTLRAAAMNGAPSSEPADWYTFDVVESVSWIGSVRLKVSPELSLGASHNRGPYLRSDIPNGPEDPPAWDQRLWSGDVAFARGHMMLRAEFLHDSWDVPNVADPAVDLGFTAEAQFDVATGWSAALRYGTIDFRDLADQGDWDWDVERIEAALGYRITLNAGLVMTYGMTFDNSPGNTADSLAGIRLWWGF